MDLKKLCFDLADKTGTSGYEKSAAETAAAYLSEYMNVETDRLGNVIGRSDNSKPFIHLDAHLDQIGLIVRGFDERGFVLIDKVGGTDIRVLTGAEVILHGKKNIFGVVCSVPPHLTKNSDSKKLDIKTMAVDTGFSKSEVQEILSIGDRITLRNDQFEMIGDKIVSGAFDDRCAVAAILYALELTKGKLNSFPFSVAFTSREETGGSGAKTSSFALMPTYSIIVDVGFGDDPYTAKSDTIKLGKGPSIGIAPVLNDDFTKSITWIAEENGIPYQHDVMGRTTGTNADSISISGDGVRTVLLSIPLRYMHTANEVIDIKDVENTGRLIAAYLLKKEDEFKCMII